MHENEGETEDSQLHGDDEEDLENTVALTSHNLVEPENSNRQLGEEGMPKVRDTKKVAKSSTTRVPAGSGQNQDPYAPVVDPTGGLRMVQNGLLALEREKVLAGASPESLNRGTLNSANNGSGAAASGSLASPLASLEASVPVSGKGIHANTADTQGGLGGGIDVDTGNTTPGAGAGAYNQELEPVFPPGSFLLNDITEQMVSCFCIWSLYWVGP